MPSPRGRGCGSEGSQGQRRAAVGYSASYLTRTVDPHLCKALSDAVREPVSKTNFRDVLQRRRGEGVMGGWGDE